MLLILHLIHRCAVPLFSLRLGHARVLIVPRTIIHYARAASLPQGEGSLDSTLKRNKLAKMLFQIKKLLNILAIDILLFIGLLSPARDNRSLPLEGKGDRLRWMRCRTQSVRSSINQLTSVSGQGLGGP